MLSITADDAMRARLTGLLQPVEIRDGNGHVLGHYTPLISPELRARYERNMALFDLEDAERVSADKSPGMTTAEVLRYLKSLENGDTVRGDMGADRGRSSG